MEFIYPVEIFPEEIDPAEPAFSKCTFGGVYLPCMPGGITIGDSCLFCRVPCLYSAMNSFSLFWILIWSDLKKLCVCVCVRMCVCLCAGLRAVQRGSGKQSANRILEGVTFCLFCTIMYVLPAAPDIALSALHLSFPLLPTGRVRMQHYSGLHLSFPLLPTGRVRMQHYSGWHHGHFWCRSAGGDLLLWWRVRLLVDCVCVC